MKCLSIYSKKSHSNGKAGNESKWKMSWNECRPIMYERMSLVTGTAQQYRHNTAQVLRMFPVACWMQTLHVAHYVTASYIIFTPTTPAVFKHGPWTPGVVDRLPVGHWHTTWGSLTYYLGVNRLPGGCWRTTWGSLTDYLGVHGQWENV